MSNILKEMLGRVIALPCDCCLRDLLQFGWREDKTRADVAIEEAIDCKCDQRVPCQGEQVHLLLLRFSEIAMLSLTRDKS